MKCARLLMIALVCTSTADRIGLEMNAARASVHFNWAPELGSQRQSTENTKIYQCTNYNREQSRKKLTFLQTDPSEIAADAFA